MLATLQQPRLLLPALAGILATILANATPAGAQVVQRPPAPATSLPARQIEKAPLPTLSADLVITSVLISETDFVPYHPSRATITIRNSGNAPAVIPAGTVLVKAEPGLP